MARYDYYQRLRPRQRAIYRKSDAITKVLLPDPEALRPAVAKLEAALQTEKRTTVLRAARGLVDGVCEALEVAAPKVRVLSRRPSSATSELHGLYERDEDEDLAVITVWMKTAAHERVVAFRTFLRTLVHEVGHHLDYELLELADSYHTEGFFRRESSLVRQLAPKPPEPEPEPEPEPKTRTGQLSLPGL